jgi:uncharacterized membrane protein
VWGWVALVLSLAGWGDSLYLTVDHFSGTIPVCSSSGIVNCALVTTSPESEVFGHLPVALLGLLFFTAMVVVDLPPLWERADAWGRRLAIVRLAMVVAGMGFVFYLVYTELFTIEAICLWCTGVHVVTFLLFLVVMLTLPAMAEPASSGRR